MIPTELLEKIEASGYGVRLGLVSTPRRFMEAISQEPTAQKIAEFLVHVDIRNELIQRLKTLLNVEHDQKYAHPHDLAIAVYLYLLQDADPNAVIELAQKVIFMSTLWWTRAMAIHTINAAFHRTQDIISYIWQEIAQLKEQIFTKSASKNITQKMDIQRPPADIRIKLSKKNDPIWNTIHPTMFQENRSIYINNRSQLR